MERYCIYKITNTVNGKGYIGFTKNFRLRLRQHKNTALKGKGHAIHAAIRKYGWENFIKEEIYYSIDKQHALEMEDVFIDLNETKGVGGYNITRGGQFGSIKGLINSGQFKKGHNTKAFKGQHHTNETRERIRNKMKSFLSDPIVREQRRRKALGNKSRSGQKQSETEKSKRRLSEVVQNRVKELREIGLTHSVIAQTLNREGIVNKCGTPWSAKSISSMFERIRKEEQYPGITYKAWRAIA